jgi:hypothetical protein
MRAGILGTKNVAVRGAEKNPGGPRRIGGEGADIASRRSERLPLLSSSHRAGKHHQQDEETRAHVSVSVSDNPVRLTGIIQAIALNPAIEILSGLHRSMRRPQLFGSFPPG